jgi:hypothetical protein
LIVALDAFDAFDAFDAVDAVDGFVCWVALLGLIIGFDYCCSRPARRVLLIP